jgi:hypothetical protein
MLSNVETGAVSTQTKGSDVAQPINPLMPAGRTERKILKYPFIALIGLLFITFAVISCEKLTTKSNPHNNELNLQVSNMWNSGCKNYQEDSLKNVLITYRDSSLYINHTALLNCGYDTVNVTMSVHDNVITLSEEESPTNANCVCKVDIAYSVGPVPAGTYQIIVLFHGITIYNESHLFQ